MRDKVKRFLSILMTALMLVNLLPVGALAEGMKLDSNSVQSKVSLTADSGTAPIETGYVYVYVKIDGASPETLEKFKLNSSGWYTIGSIRKDMPGKGEWKSYWYGGGEWVITPTPSDTKTYQPGEYAGTDVLPPYSIVGLKPWEDNKLIPLGNVRWTGYKLTTGANNYQPESIFSWHMDGIVNFKEINVPYTVKHVVKKSSPEIVLKEETKNQKYGQWTEAQALKFEGYKHVGEIVNQKIGDDPITIYVYYEPDKKQTVDVTYKTSEGGTIKNGGTYKIQPVTGNLSGGGRLPSSTPTANAGYEFAGWERDDGQTYNDLNDVYSKLNQKTADAGTYTLYQNTTFTAKFTKKANLSYTVNYLEKDTNKVLHEAKVQGGMTFEEVVNSADEVITIEGYNYDSVDKEKLTIGTGKNEINIYYTKRNDLSYTVNYYWNGTEYPVKPSKPVTGKMFGEEVTESPIGAEGYTPVSTESQTITLGTGTNEINFYYYKNVELTANSRTLTYDGYEHGVSGFTGAPEEADFSTINVGANGTDANTYPANFAEDTVGTFDKTEKYIVTKTTDGQLVIEKRKVTLTSEGGSKVYDGAPLTKPEVQIEGSFVDGEVLGIVAQGTVTDVSEGEVTNTIFFNRGTNFKESNYDIQKNEGKLSITKRNVKINPRAVTLTSETASKPYDGNPLTKPDVTVTGDGFVKGEVSEIKAKGSVTHVSHGKVTNTITYTKGANFKESNYTITKKEGELWITGRTDEVVVEIEGRTKTVTYNGEEHTAWQYDVVSISDPLYETAPGEFPNFWNKNAKKAKGTDAGTYPMGWKAEDFENTNTNFSNVTFVVTDGSLTITKRPVTLTSASDKKVYDGNALTKKEVTVGGDGFAKNEGATYNVTGTQTNVGESKNTFSYTLNEGTKADNYTIEKTEGTLKVTPVTDKVTVTITGLNKTVTYDGEEHSVFGYDATPSNKLYNPKEDMPTPWG